MISMFRALANTWVARILLGILAIAFVGWGINGTRQTANFSNAVISAGSHTITPDVFKRDFQYSLQEAEKQAGQQVTNLDAVQHGFDMQLLQGLSADESFAELTTRMGVRPAPSLIIDELRKQPDFFNPITGKFDQNAYQQKVGELQMSTSQFESQIRDEIARDQLMTGLAAGLKAPRTLGAVVANFALESRTLSFFTLDQHNVDQPSLPTDAQLTDFMKQNATELMQPEVRTLTVVRFSPRLIAANMPVDPAELQKAYEQFKNDPSKNKDFIPEKRSLVELPVKDAATAATVAKRLNAGEAPEAVAKSMDIQPIAYTDSAKSAVADPKVADAAFGLKQGQTSGVVQSELSGFAVVKVTSITPAKTPTLEELRPQLESEVKLKAAKAKAYAEVQKFDDAHGGGANITDAASKAGVAAETIGPITAQGTDLAKKPVEGVSPKLLKDAFAQAQGGEMDDEDDGNGEYFSMRVDKVTPPSLPALADVKGVLIQAYMTQEMLKRLHAKADELTAAIKKGESMDAAAASVKAQTGHAVDITRQGMAQNQALGGELLSKIFAARQGEVFNGQTAQVQVMVAHVDSVAPAAPGVAAAMVLGQRNQLSEQLFQDMTDLARQAAKARIKPTSDINLARQAIGVTPDQLGSSGPPAKAKKAPAP
jgi:peptidyl-prolyl cis-trans isomerase D